MIGTDAISRVIGKDVYDESGDKIGSASEVYLDDETGQPEWVTVRTGLFGTKESFVPIRQADLTDDGLRVPVSKAAVKDAPKIDTEGHLSPQEEQELYRYYGMDFGSGSAGRTDTTTGRTDTTVGRVDRDSTTTGTTTGTESTTGMATTGMTGQGVADRDLTDRDRGLTDRDRDLTGTAGTHTEHTDTRPAVGRDTSGPTTDNAMTRSEEQVNVGTRTEEVGRARLRKYVVNETVTETVPVSREEVRVEREPITDANVGNALDGPAISEEEHEVTLHAERPVVEKEAVPVERVRLDTETVTDTETVSADVRKEQIDVDDAQGTGRGGVLDRDRDGRIG
ncbi:DUF2382 domain-containing protein [Geodermatophilus sp. SYSU D01105]